MKILGIDPGFTSTGYGVIEFSEDQGTFILDYGTISTKTQPSRELKLKLIYDRITEIIRNLKPDAVAIEGVFQTRNLRSLVLVSEAIGVITLAAINSGLNVRNFTPLEVKSSVAGFGKAGKEQIQFMIKKLLNLEKPPKPYHASDALAVAICYKNLHC